MKTVVKNTGEVLYSFTEDITVDLKLDELIIDFVCSEIFVRAFFNFGTNTFYEGA